MGMLRHFKGTLALAACVGFIVSIATFAQAQERHFRFGYDQPHATAYGVGADIFAAKLKELSGGKWVVDQFPGAQLGQEPVMLQMVRSGDIDFIFSSSANASTLAPEAGVMSLHYLFRSEDHLRKVIADPGVNAEIQKMIGERVQGAKVLSLITMGLRDIYSKQEVHSVADMKGVKVRVQATKTEDTHFPAYGAQTVHMPFGEVYTSLQTGVVGAAENGVNVYLTNKHYEVAPVLSMTEHEANNNFLWVSQKTWDSFSPTEQKWVLAAAADVSHQEPARAFELERESAVKLEKIGVKIVRNVDKTGFMAAAKPIQDEMAKELGPHAVKLLGLIRNVQ
jgi:tripartite ATP-independent transporter DctP family solute receptor